MSAQANFYVANGQGRALRISGFGTRTSTVSEGMSIRGGQNSGRQAWRGTMPGEISISTRQGVLPPQKDGFGGEEVFPNIRQDTTVTWNDKVGEVGMQSSVVVRTAPVLAEGTVHDKGKGVGLPPARGVFF